MTVQDALTVGGVMLGVYLPKALPLLLVGDRLPRLVRRWLEYVAPAVLAALVAPAALLTDGQPALPGWHQTAYLVAFVAALATRRMLPSLALALGVLVLVAAFGGDAV